ncbi:MAG: metal-dependent hydrolase [Pseudomonadota bacterium]
MPFTPFHLGPGILLKALCQGGFSLMIYGWTQVVMDLQPLIVLLTGEGHLHGFTHTYVGATLIAVLSALSGKYLSDAFLLLIVRFNPSRIQISWPVTFISAIVGSFSHVLLDSVMHGDLQPFYPFWSGNPFLGAVSVEILHKLCVYSGLLGAAIYFGVAWKFNKT